MTESFPTIRATRVPACVTTVALAFLILASVSARADEAFERFQLWAECQPMQLVVVSSDDTARIGLTEDSIETAVRRRLRIARLHSGSSDHVLFVRVSVKGVAFSTDIWFEKWLTDPMSDVSSRAATWTAGKVGVHRGDANHLLGVVLQDVDTFIDEYLRVNESACSG